MGAIVTTITISPPQEFMHPTEFSCEGYWSPPFQGGYQPIISDMIWSDKDKFLQAVDAIETYFKETYTAETYLIGTKYYVHYQGLSPSRLVNGVNVGAGEYHDDEYGMRWPENYVSHYIQNHNVMPTERFFNYIVKRINTIPRKFLVKAGLV